MLNQTRMKPVKNRTRFNSLRNFFPLAAGILFFSEPARGIHFPDTVDLLKDYQTVIRKDGKPVELARRQKGDSASLRLEWSGPLLVAIRYEQPREFDPDTFSGLVAEYGAGASWHEFGGGKSDSVAKKKFPGLQQQWLFKGYADEKGWVGSGVDRGRYFLVFRENSPSVMLPVTETLRLGPGLFKGLDSSSEWLHVPCKKVKKGSLPICFTASEAGNFRIQVEQKVPMTLDIWLQEEESGALLGIRQALETISDQGQWEYAQELSQMLLGESQLFLVKISQRIPGLFNWPSWQLQDFKAGQIPKQKYLDLVRRVQSAGDSLPAFRYEKKGSLRLEIDLYFSGLLHLRAEELP